MTTIGVRYYNARQAAHAVRNELIAQGRQLLSARPWNMYDPDNTLWWLVPSTEWPAYKYGKLFFSPERAPQGHLFCGLHIEKGLDLSVATAYLSTRGRRLIMKDDWIWFDFIDDLSSNRLCSAIANASEVISAPITLWLEAGFVEDSELFDPLLPRPKWDTVVFEFSGSAVNVRRHVSPFKILTNVAHSQTLDDLAKAIFTIPNSNWVWLDIFIGSVFAMSLDVIHPDIWDGAQLWTKALSIWNPWFK